MRNWTYTLIFLLNAAIASATGLFDVDFADRDFHTFLQGIQGLEPSVAANRLDNFADQLQITEAQTQYWLRFKNQVLEQLNERERRRKALEELKLHTNQLNALNLLQLQQRHLEIRLQETKELNTVVIELYEKLDEPQRFIFNRAIQYVWNWH